MGNIFKNNPWAGLASYKDEEIVQRNGLNSKLFCGREEETYEVTQLINNNIFVTLYGKSGIGKTSLLNAGVFPCLRGKHYLPVSIRLSIDAANKSFQKCIIDEIEKAIDFNEGNTQTFEIVPLPENELEPNYLWSYFARTRFFLKSEGTQIQRVVFPVIALDQFEEVLRDHKDKAEALLRQIAYLLDESHALSSRKVDDVLYKYDFNFRFVISIREDNLFQLEDSIDNCYLSSLKRCRYRLRALSEQGARDVILIPGKDCIEESNKNDIAKEIIGLADPNKKGVIDTLLLSLVCARTYDKKVGEKITMDDLFRIWKDKEGEWIENVMEVYYQDAIKGLTDNKIRYIHEYFIYGDGTRKPVSSEEVKRVFGDDYLRLIEGEKQLLHDAGQGQLELLHDQLGVAVYEDKKVFEEKEKRKRLWHSIVIFSSIAVVLILIFTTLILRINRQKQILNRSQSRFVAEKAKTIIEEDSYLARLYAVYALQQSHTTEAEFLLREAVNYNSAILKGHTRQVNSVAFSVDGKRIVSASNDKSIRIWDAETGKLLKVLLGHDQFVHSAVFSPDFTGKRVVSFSKDTIRVWDVETGRQIVLINESNVKSASFSPDGKLIVSASANLVHIWDAETGNLIDSIKYTGDGKCVAFSPDGKRIIASSSIGKTYILDAKSGEVLNTFGGHRATYSKDGSRIVSVSCHYDSIYVWDAKTGCLLDSENSTFSVLSAKFNPNGDRIVFTGCSKVFGVKNTDYKGSTLFLSGHTGTVFSAVFSPDGKRVASASSDGTIRIWDLKPNTEPKTYHINRGSIRSVAFLTDGMRILLSSGLVLDSNGNRLDTLIGHNGWGNSPMEYSPDGRHIVSASQDSTIVIWDAEGSPLDTLMGHDGLVYSVDYSPNGRYIVSASQDSTIRIWDAEGNLLDTLMGHDGSVCSVKFSPDGKRIVSSSKDNTIRIWNSKTGDSLNILKGHTNYVYSVEYSPNGRHIVSASRDSTIRIWNSNTGDSLEVLKGHGHGVNSATYSPDGRFIVSTSNDNTIRVWDANTGMELQLLSKYFLNVKYAAFSPDGKTIFAYSYDEIRIWDFPPFQDLLKQTCERFKDRPLTAEERKTYYLE